MPPPPQPVSRLEIVAAPYTPFHPDGEINLGQIGAYADSLLRQSVNGVFVCGTTGEGPSLTIQERKSVAEEWQTVARGRLKIIVHVGHNCLEDACDLARHAQEIGVAATAAMPPSFFVPGSEDLLIQFCHKIATAAPEIPFYYYHIPSMTRASFPVAPWMERAAKQISNFAGVKYTHEDLADFEKCLALSVGNFQCYFGRDELLLSALKLGATAAVGSTYNYAGRLYRAIDDAFQAGNLTEAERLQKLACDFIHVLSEFGFFGAAKFLMKYIEVDCGGPRLPLAPLHQEKEKALLARLEATGLFAFTHA